MARIRTVKPELFRHSELFQAEKETGLPLRLAFVALFCCADRDGRFKWRPIELKLDCMPYDDVDFPRVLHALATRGFIVHYASGTREYGCFPTWGRHQVINNREKASEIPKPEDCQIVTDACPTRAPRDTEKSKGKGREGKGNMEGNMEGEGKGKDLCRDASRAAQAEIWAAYAGAYRARYGTDPVRNAKVNGQISQLHKRLGADAPAVAAHYLRHGAQWYGLKGHAIGPLLADAEKLHTEWQTNRQITHTTARLDDRRSHTAGVFEQLIAEARAEKEEAK